MTTHAWPETAGTTRVTAVPCCGTALEALDPLDAVSNMPAWVDCPGPPGARYDCAGCSFATADIGRMTGHCDATGHRQRAFGENPQAPSTTCEDGKPTGRTTTP